MRQRQPRIHRADHLAFVRTLPCLVCADDISTEACHIRFPDRRVDKRPVGNSEKPDDMWVLPMCGECHRRQHSLNERAFWRGVGIDPILYALRLFSVSGDHEQGCRIIAAAHDRTVNILAAG